MCEYIDDAWHKATIKDGDQYFLKGLKYTVIYDSDKYQVRSRAVPCNPGPSCAVLCREVK